MKRVKLNFFQPHLPYPHYNLSGVWEGGPYWRLRKEVWRGQRLGATTKHFHGSLDPEYPAGKAWLLVPGPHKLDFVSGCVFSGCSHLFATLKKSWWPVIYRLGVGSSRPPEDGPARVSLPPLDHTKRVHRWLSGGLASKMNDPLAKATDQGLHHHGFLGARRPRTPRPGATPGRAQSPWAATLSPGAQDWTSQPRPPMLSPRPLTGAPRSGGSFCSRHSGVPSSASIPGEPRTPVT